MNTNSIQPRRALDYTPPSEPGTWWRKATVSLAAATIGLAGLGVSTASADDSAPVTASHSTSTDRGSDSGQGSEKSSNSEGSENKGSNAGSGDAGSADSGKGDSSSGADNSSDSGSGSGQEGDGDSGASDSTGSDSSESDSTGSDSSESDSTGSDSTGSDEQAGDGGSGDSNTSNTPSEEPTPTPSPTPTTKPTEQAKPTQQAKPEAITPSKTTTASKSSSGDDSSTSRKSGTRQHSSSRHHSSYSSERSGGDRDYSTSSTSSTSTSSSSTATVAATTSNLAVDGASLPLAKGTYRLSAQFGATGSWSRYHTGMDFSAPTGTPVYAVVDGTVVESSAGGWAGTHVIIEAADGSHTLYAHLSAKTVAPGTKVTAGQQIGNVGETGRAFGAHLHFEYYTPGTRPGDVYSASNPAAFLKELGLTF